MVYCAVLEDEIETFAREYPNVVHFHKLPQGLHNDPPDLRAKLQNAIDEVESSQVELDAIVLGYGLCSRGSAGVSTKRLQLVIPRAHDCITLLLGSKERYSEYVSKHPGTYWYSPGWNRHHIPPGKDRYDTLRREYVEKYGEDNAEFLMEQEQGWFTAYDRATFVDLRVVSSQADKTYTQECANWLGWQYDEQAGDQTLLRDLLNGIWDEERFLVLQPGQTAKMTSDARVIEADHAD